MKKITTFLFLIYGLASAQQGPSIRIQGELNPFAIPTRSETEERAVVDSGATISNGTLTVSNLVVLTEASLPSPLITGNITASDINATNSLTLNNVGVATTNDLVSKLGTNAIVQTTGTNTTEVMSQNAVTDALGLKAGTTNSLLYWTATANTTNYVYTEFYDATNNVKRFTRNP